MRALFAAAFFSLSVLLGVQAASAQTSDTNQHLCTAGDLVNNTYRLIKLQETPPLREASWYRGIPYHYLAFYSENRYAYVASDHELKTPDEVRKSFTWPQQSNHVLLYRLDDQGVLDLYLDKSLKYHYRCTVINQTLKGGYQQGDLILNGYTKNNRSHLLKIYRRWF